MCTIFVSCFQDEVPIAVQEEVKNDVTYEELMRALNELEEQLEPNTYYEQVEAYIKLHPESSRFLNSEYRSGNTECDLDLLSSLTNCSSVSVPTQFITINGCTIFYEYDRVTCINNGTIDVQIKDLVWGISGNCNDPIILIAEDINAVPNGAVAHDMAQNFVYSTILAEIEDILFGQLAAGGNNLVFIQSVIPKICYTYCDGSIIECAKGCCVRRRQAYNDPNDGWIVFQAQPTLTAYGCEIEDPANTCGTGDCLLPSSCTGVDQ